MNAQEIVADAKILSKYSGLPVQLIVLAGDGVRDKAQYMRRLADFAEALRGSGVNGLGTQLACLWLNGELSDEDALDVIFDAPGGEAWAELVMSWTPEERAAALEQFEQRGWTKQTLESL